MFPLCYLVRCISEKETLMKCKDPWCDQCEWFGEDAVVRSRSKRVKKMFRRLKSKRQRRRDKRELLTNRT